MKMKTMTFASTDELKSTYEQCCEEYRRRINEQWQLDIKDSWWIPTNSIGEVLALCDCEYSLSMSDVKYFVEHETSFEDFEEWWNYNLENERQINCYSWFELGCRTEDLDKEKPIGHF